MAEVQLGTYVDSAAVKRPVEGVSLVSSTGAEVIFSASGVARLVSAAASTNAGVAKASAGKLFNAFGYNVASTARYLKVYDRATAPVVGTTVPVLTLALPPLAAFAFDFNALGFTAGIAYALTTGAADADTGALTLADVVGLNLVYA